jgi:hypothetical protein
MFSSWWPWEKCWPCDGEHEPQGSDTFVQVYRTRGLQKQHWESRILILPMLVRTFFWVVMNSASCHTGRRTSSWSACLALYCHLTAQDCVPFPLPPCQEPASLEFSPEAFMCHIPCLSTVQKVHGSFPTSGLLDITSLSMSHSSSWYMPFLWMLVSVLILLGTLPPTHNLRDSHSHKTLKRRQISKLYSPESTRCSSEFWSISGAFTISKVLYRECQSYEEALGIPCGI